MLPFSIIFTTEMKSFGLWSIYYSLKTGHVHTDSSLMWLSGMMSVLSLAHTGPLLYSRILLSASGKANLTENDGTILMLPWLTSCLLQTVTV